MYDAVYGTPALTGTRPFAGLAAKKCPVLGNVRVNKVNYRSHVRY